MRIALVNFSGNVGKTTIAQHLLSPRLVGAPIFAMESVNQSDLTGAVEQLHGRQFGELQEHLLTLEDAIIDVGASNAEAFVRGIERFYGSQEDIDCYLVPVTKERKQQADTVTTIKTLAELGVDPERIRVIFNKVEPDEPLESAFPILFGFSMAESLFDLNPQAAIEANDVYERLKSRGQTVSDVIQDTTDHKARLRAAKDERARAEAISAISIKRLAVAAHRNLEAVYAAVMQ